MARKNSLSSTQAPGVYDGVSQAYSDSNAPASFEMTQQPTAPAAPPTGEVVLWSPDGSALLMKNPAGAVKTLGIDSGTTLPAAGTPGRLFIVTP